MIRQPLVPCQFQGVNTWIPFSFNCPQDLLDNVINPISFLLHKKRIVLMQRASYGCFTIQWTLMWTAFWGTSRNPGKNFEITFSLQEISERWSMWKMYSILCFFIIVLQEISQIPLTSNNYPNWPWLLEENSGSLFFHGNYRLDFWKLKTQGIYTMTITLQAPLQRGEVINGG